MIRLPHQYFSSLLERELDAAQQTLSQRTMALSARIDEPSQESIFAGFAERCAAAEIATPSSITEALNPDWWKDIAPEPEADNRAGRLGVLLADATALTEQAISLDPIDTWNRFVDSGSVNTQLIEFHRAAQKLLESDQAQEDRCPLCLQPAPHGPLAARITEILGELEEAAAALERARREAKKIVGAVQSVHNTRRDIAKRASQLDVELEDPPDFPADDFLIRVSEVERIPRGVAEVYLSAVWDWDKEALCAVEDAIPESATERDQALVEIGVLHTLAIDWHDANREFARRRRAYGLAEQIFTSFQDRQSAYLSETLEQISVRCAEIYAFLHPDEGIDSVAVEIVTEKGAELIANFFGHREQPVQRVLSESHLGSLGLALFLAMAEAFNDSLGFLVLDDVVNSFDRDHRGRVAELLANEFDDRQLIVMTHDEQFFARIGHLAPSWVRHELTSWSYEAGPRAKNRDGEEMLEAAKDALCASDRIAAAQKGRRALEGFLQEACEELEALLPFRRGADNERRMAEEVLRGLRRTLKSRAKDLYKTIDPLLKAIESDLHAALNWEVHATQGGTSNREISDALSRIEELVVKFTCDVCGTRVWRMGSPESCRCRCGQSTFPP